MKRIAVLGDGGWGTALSILLFNKGYDVYLWSKFPDYAEFLRQKRENIKFLPGIQIPAELKIISIKDRELLAEFEIYVVAIPTPFLRETLFELKGYLNSSSLFVSGIKGLEVETLARPSQIIRELTGATRICVISGASFASEVAVCTPTQVSVASEDIYASQEVVEIFKTDFFKPVSCEDVIGVELYGALKNIIAISAGICDGLGLGQNLKAALVAAGAKEMMDIVQACGGKKETFLNICGMGDLILTSYSNKSRNYRFGLRVGKGERVEDIIKSTPMIIEGVLTTKAGFALSQKQSVPVKLINSVYEILFSSADPQEALLSVIV